MKKKLQNQAENASSAPVRLSEEERQSRTVKKVVRILLIGLIVIVLGVAAYLLLHYEFYSGYQSSYRNAYTAAEGSDFTALADSEGSVSGMSLAAENEWLKLYAAPDTGEVAVYDKRNGQIIRSNPENADDDPIANKTNKAYLHSQLVINYYNANRNAGVYDSYSMSTQRGQMTCQSIENGVRFVYGIGEITEIKYYVPNYLTQEWMDKIQSGVSEKDYKTVARMYTTQNADGLWLLIDTAKKDNSKKKKVDAVLQQVNFTEDDYYEMQTLGGEETAETLFFTVAVDYKLSSDGLEVSVPTSLIEEKGGGKIYRIQLLRFMGAAGTEESGYMVVPNGCGALIEFNNGKTSTPAYTQYIYGMDLVDSEYTVTQNTEAVRMPICGICREDSSILMSIERGASLCYLSADIAGRTNSYNYIYPVFMVRGAQTLTNFGVDGMTAEVPIIENDLYDENLTVRYTFLTEENKGYSGLANYYRTRLLEEGSLTAKSQGGDIPFFCDVIGAVKETKHVLGFEYLALESMTTFAQTEEMSKSLTNQGVRNLQINLQGWFNGGYYHDAPDSARVIAKLGGTSGLKALTETVESAGGQVFGDVAFQKVSYIAKRYMSSLESSRYYGAGYSVQLGQVSPVTLRRTASLGYSETLYSLLSPKFLPRYVQSFAKSVSNLTLSGISLRDLGDELHADKRRTNVIEREMALDIVEDSLDTLASTGKSIMVSGGNLYALKNATSVINCPMSSTDYYIIDQEIPLYQMIVHGCVDYTGEAVNLDSSSHAESILKMVEYGASCHFIFTAEDATEMKYTGMNRFYATSFDLWAQEAADTYNELNSVLSLVSDAFMTGHQVMENGIARVDYSNGITIYVNESAEALAADGLTIPAQGYLVKGGEAE